MSDMVPEVLNAALDSLFTPKEPGEREYQGEDGLLYCRSCHTPVQSRVKSILVSCGTRLAPFDIEEVRDITMYDELSLDTVGDKKTALFLIMSDTDPTFNFLIFMIYTQLFNLLCEKADDVYGGRLPVHVRCLIDECANIGQIPNLEKLVATIRSREISACLVLQTQSQLKAIYKDNADTIIGNMDSRIFLGGSEPTTLKELNQVLGKNARKLKAGVHCLSRENMVYL